MSTTTCPQCGLVRSDSIVALLAIAEDRQPGITVIFEDVKRQFGHLPDNSCFALAKIEWRMKNGGKR